MYRVMIVDDEYLLRQHIKNTIDWAQLGMEVVAEAKNGSEALELAGKLRPHIVLTDISMPHMDGLRLARKLREADPKICVIIITGYEEMELTEEAIDAGVFRYLVKPIEKKSYMRELLFAKKEIERRQGEAPAAAAPKPEKATPASLYFDSALLLASLREGENDNVFSIIDSVFEQFSGGHEPQEVRVYTTVLLFTVLMEFLAENGRTFGYNPAELMETVSGKSNAVQLRAFTHMLFEKYIEEVGMGGKASAKVKKAQAYIEENYSDTELSLNKIAEHVYINASYLSSTFKKEMGISVVDYISQLRLQKARQMLETDEGLAVSDIARRVGYSDEYYFMRCFKRVFGVSAKDFRTSE